MASEQLELSFGVHEGQLRFFTPDGELVRRGMEAALEEQARAERLAAALRAAGIDPDSVE